jgi:hypothetical protein
VKNLTKNLYLALTFVCVIALIVFIIQLIVLNTGVEPREPGQTVSGGSQGGEDPDSGADGEDPDDEGENGESEGEGPNQPIPRPPPQGTRREIRVAANTNLVIYAREELFDFTVNELDWLFEYTGVGAASLEISFIDVSTRGITAEAEAFLNNRSGSSESVSGGELAIQGSGIIGYHVSVRHTGINYEAYEAWIHDMENTDLALVFLIIYQNDEQRDALYEVLSTMDIVDME